MNLYNQVISHEEAERLFNQAFNVWADFDNSVEVEDAIHEIRTLFFDGGFCFKWTYQELLRVRCSEQIRMSEVRQKLMYTGFYLELTSLFCQILDECGLSKQKQQQFKNAVVRIFENLPDKNCEPIEEGQTALARKYLEHFGSVYFEENKFELSCTDQEKEFLETIS